MMNKSIGEIAIICLILVTLIATGGCDRKKGEINNDTPPPTPEYQPGPPLIDINGEVWGNYQGQAESDFLFQQIKKDITWNLPKREVNPSQMALVPGGTAKIGFDQRPVDVPEFYIDINVATRAEYQKCVNEKLCLPHLGNYCDKIYVSDDLPATTTFKQAERYCLYMGKRLPTEIEWEKAARGTNGRTYPWGEDPPTPEHANICGKSCNFVWADKNWVDGWEFSNPVGMFKKGDSPYGLNQMTGNVKEWVVATDEQPENTFINKGASWYSDLGELNLNNRQVWVPGVRLDDKGIRCVYQKERDYPQ